MDIGNASKTRKISVESIYRITDIDKPKQTIVKVGFQEYKTKNGLFVGLYPQILMEQFYIHDGRSMNSDGSEKEPYSKFYHF